MKPKDRKVKLVTAHVFFFFSFFLNLVSLFKLIMFHVTMAQSRVPREIEPSLWKQYHRVGLWASLRVTVWWINKCEGAAHCGILSPHSRWYWIYKGMREHIWAMRNETLRNSHPGLLLCFLPVGTFLDCLTWLPSVMEGVKAGTKDKPFPPHFAFGRLFYQNNRNLN